jgi:hypothetical protein
MMDAGGSGQHNGILIYDSLLDSEIPPEIPLVYLPLPMQQLWSLV